MGFALGSSCFVHPYISSPFFHSHSPSFSWNHELKQRRASTVPMASLGKQDSESGHSRRALLFGAISSLPFLHQKARAVVDPPLLIIRKRARAFEIVKERDAEPKALEEKPKEVAEKPKAPAEKPKAEAIQPQTISFESLPTKENELKPSKESQTAETPKSVDIPKTDVIPKTEELQKELQQENGLVTLLNGIGIVSSGVLGALYLLARQEKSEIEATIESMKTQMKKKEAEIVSLEKSFESKLLVEKEERAKKLNKAKEEQQSLMDKLNSANSTVSGLGQELKSEKRLIDKLRAQIEGLETSLSKERADKKKLEESLNDKLNQIEVLEGRINALGLELTEKEGKARSIEASLAEKESEVRNLKSFNERVSDESAKALLEIKELKDQLVDHQNEIEQKNLLVGELKSSVSFLRSEKEGLKRELNISCKEHDNLKLSSEEKAAFDAKILGEREEELRQVKEKLETALNEAHENRDVIAKLTKESERLMEMLSSETNKVKSLKHEIDVALESLAESKNESADLKQQLEKSNGTCVELEAEVSRVQAEFVEVKDSLQKSLDETKSSNKALVSELSSMKELLEKTNEELQNASNDLSLEIEHRESLRRELVVAHEKAEAAQNGLQQEKKTALSLDRDLQALGKQVAKDKEARKSLETDLEEATRSLDEMNRNALILSRDVEKCNARISDLEDEKQVLYKSLTEQKNAFKEARENLEDAHSIVMRLGQERDNLEKRVKRLEEELAMAKGEILRLRSRIKASSANSQKPAGYGEKPQNVDEGEESENITVSTKKVGSRRKRNGPQ